MQFGSSDTPPSCLCMPTVQLSFPGMICRYQQKIGHGPRVETYRALQVRLKAIMFMKFPCCMQFSLLSHIRQAVRAGSPCAVPQAIGRFATHMRLGQVAIRGLVNVPCTHVQHYAGTRPRRREFWVPPAAGAECMGYLCVTELSGKA